MAFMSAYSKQLIDEYVILLKATPEDGCEQVILDLLADLGFDFKLL